VQGRIVDVVFLFTARDEWERLLTLCINCLIFRQLEHELELVLKDSTEVLASLKLEEERMAVIREQQMELLMQAAKEREDVSRRSVQRLKRLRLQQLMIVMITVMMMMMLRAPVAAAVIFHSCLHKVKCQS